jgi:hypothetical protein
MFSKKKTPGVTQSKLATLIAHDVYLTGDLEFSEGLRMDGHVKGNVTGKRFRSEIRSGGARRRAANMPGEHVACVLRAVAVGCRPREQTQQVDGQADMQPSRVCPTL